MENQTIPAPKNIPSKFDSRFVFSDTLIRVSRLIGDEKIVENMVMSTPLPYVFTEEPIPLEFDYNLAEGLIKESYSKICWSLTSKNVPSPLMISFHLTENTIEKNVFVIFEIEIVNRKAIPEQYYEKINTSFPKICKEMIKNIDKELKEDNKDIYHYESKIFHYPREKIWEIITNFHILMTKEGIITNCSMMTPITKQGIEFSFNVPSKNIFCRLRVNKYKKDEKNDKWVMGHLPLFGPFAHSENYWTLVRLGDNETLVSNTSKYIEHIDPDTSKKLSEEKIRNFEALENFLKNSEKK